MNFVFSLCASSDSESSESHIDLVVRSDLKTGEIKNSNVLRNIRR